nr:hypothetical protein [Tanacetum cinerariifolium]
VVLSGMESVKRRAHVTNITRVNTPRSDEDRLELIELMVFLLPTVEKVRIGVNAVDLQVSAVKHMLLLLVQKFLLFSLTNWYCSFVQLGHQATSLVDKNRVVVTEAAIREVLRLDDSEGVDCLPNEEIFTELARMGYEKPSTKLTFYKAFFSSQWKKQVGDLLTHTTKYALPTLTQKHKRLRKKEMQMSMLKMLQLVMMLMEMILLLMEKFILLLKNYPYHLLPHPLHYHNHLEISLQHLRYNKLHHNHLRRVEHLEYDKVAQALEITKLKRRVKKLEKGNKVRVLKLRRLQKVGTSQRVDTFDDTVMDDESNQGRMIAKMDKDDAVVLMDDKKEDKKVEEAKDEAELAKVQEVVDVVATAKLITKVGTAASEIVTAASAIIHTAGPQVSVATLSTPPARVVAAPNDDVYIEATLLARKVPVVDYEIIKLNNKPYYKIIRADGTHKLYISFLTLLKNFDREDLEALWNLVKEGFSTAKPKNFFDDFLLTTLGAMFEKPDAYAQI